MTNRKTFPKTFILPDTSAFESANDQQFNIAKGDQEHAGFTASKISKEVDWPMPATIIGAFEATTFASSPIGKGYRVDASIHRTPYSSIGRNDPIFVAFWCSGKTKAWYSDIDRKTHYGSQTGWIPAGQGGVVWIPTPDYNPAKDTIVHALFVMRHNFNSNKEIVKWVPGNNAPFPYTRNDRLKPANPREEPMVTNARRVYRISPGNPRGLELWGRKDYRFRL